jgi:hypothetical protein
MRPGDDKETHPGTTPLSEAPTQGPSPPPNGFQRRVKKWEKNGFLTLHANEHLANRTVRLAIETELTRMLSLGRKDIVFLGTGSPKMRVTSWALKCSRDTLRMCMLDGKLTTVAPNGESILLSMDRIHAPAHSLVVAYSQHFDKKDVQAAVASATMDGGWSLRQKNENGNWLIDNLSPDAKRMLLGKGLVITSRNGAEICPVIDPAHLKSKPSRSVVDVQGSPNAPLEHPASSPTNQQATVSVPSSRVFSAAPWTRSVHEAKITNLERTVAELAVELADAKTRLKQSEMFIEKLLTRSESATAIGGGGLPIPYPCGQQWKFSAEMLQDKASGEAQVLEPVISASGAMQPEKLPPSNPAVQQTGPVQQPRIITRAKQQVSAQVDVILQHKDSKDGTRKYLVKELQTGRRVWRDATWFQPDSEIVLLYEASVPRLQVKPKESQLDQNSCDNRKIGV